MTAARDWGMKMTGCRFASAITVLAGGVLTHPGIGWAGSWEGSMRWESGSRALPGTLGALGDGGGVYFHLPTTQPSKKKT